MMLAMQQMMWDWIIFCRLAWNVKSKTKAIDRSVARESRSPTTRYLYMTLEQMQEVLNEMLSVQQELQNSQLKFTESLTYPVAHQEKKIAIASVICANLIRL